MPKQRSIQTRNYQKMVYNTPSTASEKKCSDALISLTVNGVLKDKGKGKGKGKGKHMNRINTKLNISILAS